jgi:hypothetical protein
VCFHVLGVCGFFMCVVFLRRVCVHQIEFASMHFCEVKILPGF